VKAIFAVVSGVLLIQTNIFILIMVYFKVVYATKTKVRKLKVKIKIQKREYGEH
jgi:hypothetical protein